MKETLQKIGQLLCVGFEGQQCGAELRSFLAEIRPGGVIFFQRNIAAPDQLRSLVADIREVLKDSAPLLAIDQEGGAVDRFRELFGPLPSAWEAAQAGLAFELGALAGRELAAFGLTVDFAPVLDLLTPESQPILGTRAAGSTPQQVIQFAEQFLGGLAVCAVLGCGKHFPGLGAGRQDSHLAMPRIDRTEMALWNEDLLPFRRLADVLPMIMVAHAAYPALEKALAPDTAPPERPIPASMSPGIVSGLLRGRIGYRGLVVCDDLEMGGAVEGRTIEAAAITAVLAGCDLLLVCRSADKAERVVRALAREAGNHTSFRQTVAQAAQRIARLKQTLAAKTAPASESLEDWGALQEAIGRLRSEVSARLRPRSEAS
ncbi:MAG TPA: beta-N-acetylhexosaminidase [Terriglobia bacterium]|nr:beta-N-acetylhexosaminidase [Terriglobia bacterium]